MHSSGGVQLDLLELDIESYDSDVQALEKNLAALQMSSGPSQQQRSGVEKPQQANDYPWMA